MAMPTITGMAISMGQKELLRSCQPSYLLNTPRLMMIMWVAG